VIPALRQSTAELLACEELYIAVVIQGRRPPANLGSERGTEVHDVMWRYITLCVIRNIPSDWAALDRLAAAKGPEAREICQNLRDSYVVNWRHSMGAELTLRLDHLFQPTEDPELAAFEGTLDHLENDLLAGAAGSDALITDFKTHPAPFEPDTIQAHLYSLLVLQTYAHVERVKFELVFARYQKCRRSVTYTRADVPALIEYMQGYRERQVDLHRRWDNICNPRWATIPLRAVETVRALPGPHCQYCPRLADVSCPIAEFNPALTRTPEDRLRFNVWAAHLKAQNDEVLKAVVIGTEKNITIADGNGARYEYGAWPTVKLEFPLRQTYMELEAWHQQTGEDLMPALVVGATKLKQLLGARKRKDLADELANIATPKPGAKWGVRSQDSPGPEEDADDGDNS
jgi:hypothetical protein